MDQKTKYAGHFLETSLGLACGSVDPGTVSKEFVDSLSDAVKGSEGSGSPTPLLEAAAQEVGHDIVQSILDTRGFVLWKERWPKGARFAACLTHDVDHLSWPVSHLMSQRSRFSAADFLLGLIGARNLYDNTPLAVQMERQRNLRSSFYFLTDTYDLRPKARLLASIRDQGWDVGLHGEFGTHDSLDNMRLAIANLNQAINVRPAGVREHFLHFDFGSTWKIMDDAGFIYDSTVGNTDKAGFRIGLCNPFHPPNEDWEPLKLLEIPLGLMDTTLWGYLKRSEREGLNDFLNLKKGVMEVGGLFTILWHPESFRMRGGRIYPKLLDMLVADGCFIGSGLDIARWWLRREAPLLREGKTFRMGDAAPGLVLGLKSKAGEAVKLAGGTLRTENGLQSIEALGGPLEVTLQ